MLFPPPSNCNIITIDRGGDKISLTEFIRDVFCADELECLEDTYLTDTSEITFFFGALIENYADECDAIYRIPDNFASVIEFNQLVRKKIMDVYKVSLTTQVNLLEILNIIDNQRLN